MGKIYQPRNPEDHREAEPHEAIHDAGHESGDDDVEKSREVKGHVESSYIFTKIKACGRNSKRVRPDNLAVQIIYAASS
jgi:hypothetical protein